MQIAQVGMIAQQSWSLADTEKVSEAINPPIGDIQCLRRDVRHMYA